jgi:hypothetical protein
MSAYCDYSVLINFNDEKKCPVLKPVSSRKKGPSIVNGPLERYDY